MGILDTTMSISQQVFAPLATTTNDGRDIVTDVNSFILRILLFDTYIIESSMLRDLAQLAAVFGADGLTDIINSGAVRIHIDALSIGQAEREFDGQKFPIETLNSPGLLPLLHYEPLVINMADRSSYVHRALENLRLPRVGKKTVSKLQNAVTDKLTVPPEHNPKSLLWSRESLLSNNELVALALEQALLEKHNANLVPTAFNFEFKKNGNNGYVVTTNMGRLFGLSAYDEHKLFEAVVLKVTGFYQRISLMNAYESIAWFSDVDARLLDAEIKLKLNEYDSSNQERRFTRILNIVGLPMILPSDQVSANSLLRLRVTKECKDFRAWLSTSDAKSDNDIKRELGSFKAAFSAILHSGTTRAIRFILPNALGLSPVASIATQSVDHFIVEKLLPTNGPIAFINNKLPPVWLNDPYKN